MLGDAASAKEVVMGAQEIVERLEAEDDDDDNDDDRYSIYCYYNMKKEEDKVFDKLLN